MKYKLAGIWMVCMVLGYLSGCVSKAQLESASNEHERTQLALQETSQALDRCEQDKKALQAQNEADRSEIRRMSQRIDEQNQAAKNKDAIIALQQSFIRLFDDSKQTLQTSINEQIADQQMDTQTASPPVRVVLVNRLLFESGSAQLSEGGKRLLGGLTGLLQEGEYPTIRVHGHTDDRPLKPTAPYASNWELSVARATAVVHFLQETVGIKPERMSATGFGPYRPIAANDTEAGRRQNRRIEIIVQSTPDKQL